MKVPMKVDYGVRALIDLAERYGSGSVQTVDIAERQNIPEPYLDHVLTSLGKSGLIRSRRGPRGGHELAKEPDQIDLGMVMTGLDGTVATLDCIPAPMECSLSDICSQRDVWKSVEEAIQNVLRSTTIADLAARQKTLIKSK